MLLALALASVALAAAPPVWLTSEYYKKNKKVFALADRAVAEWKAGKRDQAVASMTKALAGAERAFGHDHKVPFSMCSSLAEWERERGNLAAAAAHMEQRWRILKAMRGVSDPTTMNALWLVRTTRRQAGWTAEQKKQARRAADLHAEAFRLWQGGQPAKALLPAREVIAIRRSLLGEKDPNYAVSLNNLAELYRELGDYRAALPLTEKALEIIREALGEEHPYSAKILQHLAGLNETVGNHRVALFQYQKALDAIKKARGEKHAYSASILNGLAGLYWSMGDYKAALPLQMKATEVSKEVLGEKHPDFASSLNNLATLFQKMGRNKEALSLSRRALAIKKEALGERHPDYAVDLVNLASLYLAMGEYRAALSLCQKALAMIKEGRGERNRDYVSTLRALAGLYRLMGDHKAALLRQRQALNLTRETVGELHPSYARSLTMLAGLHLSMGDHEAALPLAEEAVRQALAYLRTSATAQSDRQQLAASAHLRYQLDARLSLLDAAAYSHALAWKGAVLMRQRQRRLFSALSSDPKTRKATEELQAVTRQIAVLSASTRPAREQLKTLTAEQERLQAGLSKLSAEANSAFKAKALTPAAISEALPEGTVLVDYHFYLRDGLTFRDGTPNIVEHLVAFVTRSGKPLVRIDLGPAQRATEAVRQWRGQFVAGKTGLIVGARVKELVWSPLKEHLEGAKLVLVSPDGSLGAMPFGALPGTERGTYLVEEATVAVVPVPQMLPEMLHPKDKASRLKPSLLVVSEVDYDRASPARAKADVGGRGVPLGARRHWGRLPATFAEAASVSEAFRDLFEGGTVTSLRKGAATKARVREALAQVRYAHLATHGFFSADGLKNALEINEKPDPFFGRGGVAGWHPLLLSGVVLTGANREPKAGEEDGILTALEVSEMQLPRLELAVLSACETGLGNSAGGEGLLGLQRAFQVAGARTVVASLWEVPDQATQALMSEFYRVAWDPDSIVSRAEALRRAQLYVLKEGKRRGIGKKAEKLPKGETHLPPLYWAAFVLSGDWR
jgi:CHAT domain-containing protein